MSLQLTIPDSVLNHLHLPDALVESELRKQLAIALYAKGMIAFDAAVELAGVSCWDFGRMVNVKDLSARCSRFDANGDVLYRCSE